MAECWVRHKVGQHIAPVRLGILSQHLFKLHKFCWYYSLSPMGYQILWPSPRYLGRSKFIPHIAIDDYRNILMCENGHNLLYFGANSLIFCMQA